MKKESLLQSKSRRPAIWKDTWTVTNVSEKKLFALIIDPNYADARLQLGRTFVRMQDWPHAYEELSRAVEIEPDNFPAQIELTRLLIVSGVV